MNILILLPNGCSVTIPFAHSVNLTLNNYLHALLPRGSLIYAVRSTSCIGLIVSGDSELPQQTAPPFLTGISSTLSEAGLICWRNKEQVVKVI